MYTDVRADPPHPTPLETRSTCVGLADRGFKQIKRKRRSNEQSYTRYSKHAIARPYSKKLSIKNRVSLIARLKFL